MKWCYLTILMSWAFLSFAQQEEVNIAFVEHNDNLRQCIHTEVEPEPEFVKEQWEAFMKERYDINVKGTGFFVSSKTLTAEEVKIPSITDKNMDVFARIVEDEDEASTDMCVFMALGYDLYLTEEEFPEEMKSAKQMVRDFIPFMMKNYYEEKISETNEQIEDLQKEISELQQEINEKETVKEETRQKIDALQRQKDQLERNLEKYARELTGL